MIFMLTCRNIEKTGILVVGTKSGLQKRPIFALPALSLSW
jgi:hypothetical protein